MPTEDENNVRIKTLEEHVTTLASNNSELTTEITTLRESDRTSKTELDGYREKHASFENTIESLNKNLEESSPFKKQFEDSQTELTKRDETITALNSRVQVGLVNRLVKDHYLQETAVKDHSVETLETMLTALATQENPKLAGQGLGESNNKTGDKPLTAHEQALQEIVSMKGDK
jgi:chromosome segregation ATPase